MILSRTEWVHIGQITASGNTTARPIITKYDQEMVVFLDISAVEGTNPTLDVVLKVYDSVSNQWYTLCSFATKTGIGSDVGYVQYGLNDRVAAFYTIGGADSPSFTFTLSVHLKGYSRC